jgi:multiple sugar transport system permease protein
MSLRLQSEVREADASSTAATAGNQPEVVAPEAGAPSQGHSLTWWGRRSIKHLLLICGAVVMVAPLVFSIFYSLMDDGQITTVPPPLVPHPFVFSNYPQLFDVVPFLTWFINSTIVTVAATIGAILSSTLGGYAFARLRFPGRNVLFVVCVMTMMLPAIVLLIPQFIIYRDLKLINSFGPLIIPSCLGVPFYMFLARQTFRGIPRAYEDAARVDGASNWYIWRRVMMPMSKPLIAAIAIFSIIFNWNDFLYPLIYLNATNKWTLAVGLPALISTYSDQWNVIMAGAALMIVPMLIVFFVAQRYFMESSITIAGLGGR